jgi:hypothetical protein
MRYLFGLEKGPGLLRDCLDGGGLELRLGEGVRIQFARPSARAWRTWLRIVPIIGLYFGVELSRPSRNGRVDRYGALSWSCLSGRREDRFLK